MSLLLYPHTDALHRNKSLFGSVRAHAFAFLPCGSIFIKKIIQIFKNFIANFKNGQQPALKLPKEMSVGNSDVIIVTGAAS